MTKNGHSSRCCTEYYNKTDMRGKRSHLKLYAAFKKTRNVVTAVAKKEKANFEFIS